MKVLKCQKKIYPNQKCDDSDTMKNSNDETKDTLNFVEDDKNETVGNNVTWQDVAVALDKVLQVFTTMFTAISLVLYVAFVVWVRQEN